MDFKAKIKQEWPAIVILAVAAAARLTLLGIKPPHFDEGVNGWFVDQMTHTGFYHYDPTNYHGPLHFYVLFLAQTLLGRHIWALRLPLALVSLATVYLTLRFDRFIGRGAALWAAAAMAVSPGCVFYGRYAIHECWLVFSLMLVAWGLAGLWQLGERKYLWAVWIGITGAVLTKETYVIHFACAALALPCVWLLGMASPAAETGGAAPQEWTARDMTLGALLFAGCVGFFCVCATGAAKEPYVICFVCGALSLSCGWLLGRASPTAQMERPASQRWTARDMMLGALLFAGCVVFFYSGTFMDMRGLKGLYETFGAWAQTGRAGNGHEKAWYYWLQLFGRYEWPSCVGLLVALACVLPRTPRLIRGLAIYATGTLAAYSIIHYKTPWCVVSLTWPYLLLFGCGVDFAFRKYGSWTGVAAATLLAANLCDMVALNFFHFTDAKEPYVYVQTFPDIDKLMKPLDALIARNPANYQLTGHIMVESYHPLPWLLGDFPNIGYYDDDTNPPKMDADFLLVEETRIDDAESALREEYFTAPLSLRDAQDPLKLYLNVKKFRSLFPGRKPDFEPREEAPPEAPPAAKPGSSSVPAGHASQ